MRNIEKAYTRYVSGYGSKPSKELLVSLATSNADSLINILFNAINYELETFIGCLHTDKVCDALKDVYMIIGISDDIDHKLVSHKLRKLCDTIDNLELEYKCRFTDPFKTAEDLNIIRKEIEELRKQLEETNSKQYDFMRYLIGDIHNISYLEYALEKIPNLVNVKDKEGNTLFQNAIEKYMDCILKASEEECLYYSSVISLMLSDKRLRLPEHLKRKVIDRVYQVINHSHKPKKKELEQLRELVERIQTKGERQTFNNLSKKYNIPITFQIPILEQIRAQKSPNEYKDRLNINDYIITIDKAGATEIDDGLSCIRLPNGNFLYGIHISTALGYFPYNSPIIEEALKRTRSIYLPKKYQDKEKDFNKIIPIFPYDFAANKGSLIPLEPRLARSYYYEITPEGEIVQEKFLKTIISSKKKTSYREIDNIIEHGTEDRELQDLVTNLQAVTEALEKRYKPSKLYEELKESNDDYSDLRVKRYGSEKIVYYAMLLTGNRVGTFFADNDYPCLYRVLRFDEEETKKLQAYIQGLTESYGGEQYQKLNQLVNGLYPKGWYALEGSHEGLGLDHYCHITSELRRGADIVVEHGLEVCYDKTPTDKELYKLQEEMQRRANQINAKQDPIEWFVRDYKRAYQKRR